MKTLATIPATAAFIVGLTFTTSVIAADQVVNDQVAGNVDEPAPCDVAPDQTTIQAGITAAGVGDDVAVCPGIYVEDLEITTDGLTIAAVDRTDKANTVIQGTHVASPASGFPNCGVAAGVGGTKLANINISANGVTITGFTIQSPAVGADEYTCGLITDGTDNKIYHNHFLVSSGDPVSESIQTWANANGPIGDNSGLTIIFNQFSSSEIDTAPNLGYEGPYINPQTETEGRDPVVIGGNSFEGNLLRGVTLDSRSFTDVKHNTFVTELNADIVEPALGTDEFPRGIQVSGDTANSKIFGNEVTGNPNNNRFAYGILVRNTTSGNVFQSNFVRHSGIFDCLDESTDSGTAGTANLWTNNNGVHDDPKGICRPNGK